MRCSARPWRRCCPGFLSSPSLAPMRSGRRSPSGRLRASPADRFATCAAFLSPARARRRRGAAAGGRRRRAVARHALGRVPGAMPRDGSAGTRVALLASARPDQEGPLLGSTVPSSAWTCRASARGRSSAAAGLDARGRRGVVDRLVELAAGNPLALRELPARLSEDASGWGSSRSTMSRSGAERCSRPSRPGSRRSRPDDRAAVVVASAAVDREPGPVVAACRDLGIATSALERAEAAGVLASASSASASRIRCVKAVAYERTSPGRAPARPQGRLPPIATMTPARGISPPRRSARMTRSPTCSRPPLEGRAVAEPTASRPTPSSGGGFSERSRDRAHRVYGAALAAALGGDYHRCAALLEPLTEIDDPLQRARIRHTIALVTMTGGMRVDSRRPRAAERGGRAHPARSTPRRQPRCTPMPPCWRESGAISAGPPAARAGGRSASRGRLADDPLPSARPVRDQRGR